MSDEQKSIEVQKPKRASAPRMPKQVKSGAHIYDVHYEKELKDENGDAIHADCNDDDNILRMERNMSRTKKQEIALHEVLHTCFYGIPDWNEELEEKFVSTLAPRLLQIIQDNPELIAFLQYKSPSKKKG